MKTWAVANHKGGVGKTTTVVALGSLLAGRGDRTLLLDLDPQGSLSSWLRVERQDGVGVEALFREDPAMVMERDIRNVLPGLDLLPGSAALATLDRQPVSGRGLSLRAGLDAVRDEYAIALLDCPPALGVPMISSVAACTRLLIPVQTEFLALEGLGQMLRTLAMVERSLARSVPWTILPTMFDARTGAGRRSLEALRDKYPERTWTGVIPVDTRLRDAAEAGTPAHGSPERAGAAYESLLGWLAETDAWASAGAAA